MKILQKYMQKTPALKEIFFVETGRSLETPVFVK